LIVEADYLDVLREPRILAADITGRCVTLDELAADDGRCVLLAANRPCRFLSPDGRCTIYPTRPNVCVGMEAGDEQCQEARNRLGLPMLASRSCPTPVSSRKAHMPTVVRDGETNRSVDFEPTHPHSTVPGVDEDSIEHG